MSLLRVVVVDDERLARSRVASAIADIPDVEVVGEAASGGEAADLIERENPSVVLLDIEMPDGDGFYVAQRMLELPVLPEIVFVTAFSSYAAQAFESGAADYLLKPFSVERLSRALQRARDRIRSRTLEQRVERLQQLVDRLRQDKPASALPERLWFRTGKATVRVGIDDIRYISADRDYVEIVTAEETLHVRHTISALVKQLGGDVFVRVHRSHIVRKSQIRQLRSIGNGKYEIALDCGHVLPVGGSFKAELEIP
ncbi:MAG: LytTR family DNA-binding domain-containing protein [Pseudomonadota bacterium]